MILTCLPEPAEGHRRGLGRWQVWIVLVLYWASVEDFIVRGGERYIAELKTLGYEEGHVAGLPCWGPFLLKASLLSVHC